MVFDKQLMVKRSGKASVNVMLLNNTCQSQIFFNFLFGQHNRNFYCLEQDIGARLLGESIFLIIGGLR
jgi:hypothetical protein